MPDVLTSEQRQLNMSRVRGRDTKPEMLVRRGLHARGLRYRLHDRRLPGRPDLVFPRYSAVVFVHGCPLSKPPATRQDFWRAKLESNAARDRRAIDALQVTGWRVLVIWECALRVSGRRTETDVMAAVASGIRTGSRSLLEFTGQNAKRTNTENE
jgi:DNA mismatch endonuclease (patch repair protein)